MTPGPPEPRTPPRSPLGSAAALLLTLGLTLLAALIADPPDTVAPREAFGSGGFDDGPSDPGAYDEDDDDLGLSGGTPVGPASLIARFREFEAILADAEAEAARPDAEPERPEVARFRLERFAAQVGATADELLREPDATPAQRLIAAEAKLAALARLAQLVPEVHDDIVDAADALDRRKGNEDLAPVTALYRVRGLCFDITPEILGQLTSGRFAEVVEATIRLAGVEPPPAQAPEILFQVAAEAERRGLDREARALFARHAERFPTGPAAKFSAGRARRLAAKGEVLEGFAGPGPDGVSVRLDDLRGKYVLVAFWASWDDASLAEADALEEARDRLGGRGLAILGVNLDTDADAARRAIAEAGMDWPQILAAEGLASPWESDLGLRFGVSGLPFKLVVDRDGRLVEAAEALGEVLPIVEDALILGPAR